MGKSKLLVLDLPKPRSFWELDQEVKVKPGAGALNIDPDMVAELTKAFQEPSTTTKVTDAVSAYKIPAELYTLLFKTPKVEEEMVKQVGNIRPLAITPDLRKALEASFESSMVIWQLGWHMMVMINYLCNHCQADPVLKAVCNHLHGAIRESRQTSAQAALVAIAAQCHMILDASAFWVCRSLRATLLSTPFVGYSLFGGQLQSSVEEATRSQEKLSQAQGLLKELPVLERLSSPRNVGLFPLFLPLQSAQSVRAGGGDLGAKRHRSKNRGNNRRSALSQAQQGVSNKRPPVRSC